MLTMCMAGLRALFETDIKKIIALSTLRQLGMIILRCGQNIIDAAFLHMLTHAYFKALLFITVGNLIHLRDGYQDSRKLRLGGPAVSPTMAFRLAANFSLIGLPYMAGFYSKDLIIESIITRDSPEGVHLIVFLFMYSGIFLTAAYTTRFLVRVLSGASRSPKSLWAKDTSVEVPVANFILLPIAVMRGSLLS